MKLSRLFPPLLLAAMFCSPPASSGINSWTGEGPLGGSMHQLAVHPAQPDVLLMSTLEGVLRTTNGGADWVRVLDLSNASVVFDPLHPGRVYAGWSGLFRSDDSGATFTRMTDSPGRPYSVKIAADGMLYGPSDNFSLARSADEGQTWTVLPRPWPDNTLVQFVLDPNDAAVLYVYVRDTGTFRSADRGATWSTPVAGSPGTNVGPQPPRDVWSFVVQPGNSNRLLASTGRGIRISNDAGATWSDAAPFRFAAWIGYHATNPQRAIALGLHNEVMRSDDGGVTWPQGLDGADPRIYGHVQGVIDPSTPERLWASSPNGPAVSSDWGATFALRNGDRRGGDVARFATALDGTVYAAFSSPVGIYRRSGASWVPLDLFDTFSPYSLGAMVSQFAVAPGDRNVLYASNIDRVFARSLDGGVTWNATFPNFPAPGQTLSQIAVSPSAPGTVFAATYNQGLMRSTDGGSVWSPVAGLPAVVSALAIDVADPNVMYAGAGSFIPDTVYKSTNGGVAWAPTGALSGASVYGIEIDPADSQTIYAANNSRLSKSVNGGATWTEVPLGGNSGFPTNSQLVLIDPVRSTTLVANGVPGHNGLARSVDGGATWETIPSPPSSSSFNVVQKAVLDPAQPSRIIANPSARGLMTFDVSPDLALSITGLDAPLGVGGNATVNAIVRNRGPFASSASEVRITLPAWLTPAVPAHCTLAANTLTCRIDALRVDQSLSIPLTLAVAATPGTGTVTANVEGHETDPDASNDSVTMNANSAREADLQLQIEALGTSIARTTSSRLTSTVRNAGPNAAPVTRVVYDVPAGLTAVAATSTVGTCSVAGVTVTCLLGDLAVDATATIGLDLRGDVSGSYGVTGAATSQAADGTGPTSVTSNVSVIARGDARIQVNESAGAKVAGTPFTYNVVVRNDGPDALTLIASLTLTGANVTTATATVPGGACTVTATRGQCAYTAFPAGTEFTMTVTVNAASAGSVTAEGIVLAQGSDPVPGNNTITVATSVAAAPSSSSGGGGKGGGGSLEWFGLMLLGLIAFRRRVGPFGFPI